MWALYLFLMCFIFDVCSRDASVFTVYRSATTSSSWYTHLVNANAADKGGALSYLHTEVIPFNNRPPTCTRRWNYDIIALYEVTVMNPPNFGGGNGPNIGLGFSAMDSGLCTVPGCQELYEHEGYFVGGQTQKGNCRAAYGETSGSAYWYSFPAEGQCAKPDGSKRCTYTARYIGKLKIDDLINSKGKQIEPNFNQWCMALGWEFQAQATSCPGSCDVQWAIDFWKAPCDPVVCQKRIDMLKDAAKSGLVDRSIPNGCDGATLKTFKYNGQCVRDCPSDTYLDWGYNCIPCNASLHCATCNWAVAPPSESTGQGGTHCLSCNPEYPVLADGLCLSSCPAGLYFAQNVKQCLPCASMCSECADTDTTCTKCRGHEWLMGGKCLAICPSGFFGEENTCVECDACGSNGTCSNATFCTSCGSNYHITVFGMCVAECPARTFLDDRQCKACHSTCLTCSKSGESDCISCSPDQALEAGRCVPSCTPGSFKNLQARCVACNGVIAGCSKCMIKNGTAPTCLACGSEPALQYLHAGLCKTGCPVRFSPEPGPPNTFICVVTKPTNSPTSLAPTAVLAAEVQTADGTPLPAIIACSAVAAFVVAAGLLFWRCRVHRQKKFLNTLTAGQELYEKLAQ